MLNTSAAKPTFTFAFVILPKFSSFTLSCLVEPLRIANYCDGNKIYDWKFLSVAGDAVPSASCIPVQTQSINEETQQFDAIIVCGGWNSERYDHPDLLRWLRLMGRKGTILGAAEIGTYVLARAGLLEGYQSTIHWHCHSAFKESYTELIVKEQLFVIDRKRMTCAGGTACLDMMLRDIEKRHNKSLAIEVADQLVYNSIRDSELPQKEVQGQANTAPPPALQGVIEFMENNIEEPISIPEICGFLDLTQRKLERLFNRYYDCSAVAFYRALRLQHARTLLTQTNMSVLDIGVACGFSSSSYFSKSYTDMFDVRPRDHRTSWPEHDATPFWPGVSKAMTTARPKHAKRILAIKP
ncbi:GlxA family transcriptional regulator [Dasania marina]|uniref:GlxA family transcriptional regulator n=1 Tax=Dasania marina TaxID=471499 RepID=UPI000379880D|nr:GlxA family transcriptional regulator [Dasania marina]